MWLNLRFRLVFLLFQNKIEFSQLGKSNGCVQFADAIVVSEKKVVFKTSVIANMIMTVICVSINRPVQLIIVRDDRPSFSACDGLYRIE